MPILNYDGSSSKSTSKYDLSSLTKAANGELSDGLDDFTPSNIYNAPMSDPLDPRLPQHKTIQHNDGSVEEIDESIGRERRKFTHASGSSVEYNADGTVRYIARGGKYSVVFGPDEAVVHGSLVQVIKGDYTLRCDRYAVKAGSVEIEGSKGIRIGAAEGGGSVEMYGAKTTIKSSGETILTGGTKCIFNSPTIDLGGTGKTSQITMHGTKVMVQGDTISLGGTTTRSLDLYGLKLILQGLNSIEQTTSSYVEKVHASYSSIVLGRFVRNIIGAEELLTIGNKTSSVSGMYERTIFGEYTDTVGGNKTSQFGAWSVTAPSINYMVPSINILGKTIMTSSSIFAFNTISSSISVTAPAIIGGSSVTAPNVTGTLDVIAGSTRFSQHTHGGVTNGAGHTGPPSIL